MNSRPALSTPFSLTFRSLKRFENSTTLITELSVMPILYLISFRLNHFLGIWDSPIFFFAFFTGAKYSIKKASLSCFSFLINSFLNLLLSTSSINPEAMIPAGNANIPTPRIAINPPRNFPAGVIGNASPP